MPACSRRGGSWADGRPPSQHLPSGGCEVGGRTPLHPTEMEEMNLFFCEEICSRAGMSDVAQLPELTHPREGIVPSEHGTDGRETLHSPLTGWTPLIVGNQKKISSLVFYVTAWCSVVHRDKAIL